MLSLRTLRASLLATVVVFSSALAQDETSRLADIQSDLASMYQLARTSADGTDIVTAGSVLILQKDGLVMNNVTQPYPLVNVYKNGALTRSALSAGLSILDAFGQSSSSDPALRTFLRGEKFWITALTTKTDGVTLSLMSDLIRGSRYRAVLKFPFARGQLPAADDFVALVGEVVKVDMPQQQAAAQGDQGGGTASAPPAKTIAVGQSRDEVIATLGVPTKIVKLRSKEIDYFPNMKVTFVKETVTKIE